MKIVKYNDEVFECAVALKGPDYIHLLDDKGRIVSSFEHLDGLENFELTDEDSLSWVVDLSYTVSDVVLDPEDNTIYILDGNGNLIHIDINGNTLSSERLFEPQTSTTSMVLLTASGTEARYVAVADYDTVSLYALAAIHDGPIWTQTIMGQSSDTGQYITQMIASKYNMYIVTTDHTVYKFTTDGKVWEVWLEYDVYLAVGYFSGCLYCVDAYGTVARVDHDDPMYSSLIRPYFINYWFEHLYKTQCSISVTEDVYYNVEPGPNGGMVQVVGGVLNLNIVVGGYNSIIVFKDTPENIGSDYMKNEIYPVISGADDTLTRVVWANCIGTDVFCTVNCTDKGYTDTLKGVVHKINLSSGVPTRYKFFDTVLNAPCIRCIGRNLLVPSRTSIRLLDTSVTWDEPSSLDDCNLAVMNESGKTLKSTLKSCDVPTVGEALALVCDTILPIISLSTNAQKVIKNTETGDNLVYLYSNGVAHFTTHVDWYTDKASVPWYSDMSSIKVVHFDPTCEVATIKYYFLDAANLLYVNNLPDSITNMEQAFKNCSSLLKVPTLPVDVTTMSEAFYNCKALAHVPNIPSGVTSLYHTFYGCSSLVEAPVLPTGVTNLEDTFGGCSALTEPPIIPSHVTSMLRTFSRCTKLLYAPVLPDSVTTIAYAFENCKSLKYASSLPVECYGYTKAFYACESLIHAPEIPRASVGLTLTSMFEGCTKLVTPPSVVSSSSSSTRVNSMFKNCTALSGTITIDIKVTSDSMYSDMFYGAATNEGCQVVVNYTEASANIIDGIIATKSPDSNIVKGSLVTL